MISDPLVMPLAQEMLVCLDQEIAKVESPPKYVQLRPGDVVAHLLATDGADECCEGLAWVRPAGFAPSSVIDQFPAIDATPRAEGVTGWAVVLEIGAIRCAPTPDASRLPTAEEWETVTQAVMDDAAAMRRAICCFIEGLSGSLKQSRLRVLAGAWEPLPIAGGCVGGVMTVTVRGPECDCADAGPVS